MDRDRTGVFRYTQALRDEMIRSKGKDGNSVANFVDGKKFRSISNQLIHLPLRPLASRARHTGAPLP